jgi:multidrug resistance efflux pump
MTKKNFKRPSLRLHRRHLVRQVFNGWPWLVWIAAAVAVLVLLPGGMYRVRFHGIAERTYEYVSPLENARLKSLLVEMGDTVQAGQLIGELDNDFLAMELKLEEAKTAAELKALEAQWARSRELLAKNLVLEQETEDLRPQIEALKEVLALYPGLIAQLEDRLVATTAGVIAEVLHQPGDIVQTGDPVVRISNVSTSRIIAFMSEENRTNIAEGERCRIITSADREVLHGVVKSITADIRKLPVFTGFSDQLLRGRRIVIEIVDGSLVPGEQVVVVPDISIFEQWFGKK